jgi:hypothetical protein
MFHDVSVLDLWGWPVAAPVSRNASESGAAVRSIGAVLRELEHDTVFI